MRPSARTSGGHRRYTVTDIANLQRIARLIASGTPAAIAAATTSRGPHPAPGERHPTRPASATPAGELVERFVRAANLLDSTTQARAAEELLDALGVVHGWTAVFAPYLRSLGRRWEGTHTGIECEHLTVAVLQAVLDRHTWRADTSGPTVLLAATANEYHTLPLHAAAAALTEHNLSPRIIGRLPVSSILAAVGALQPSAVLVWAHRDETSDVDLLDELITSAPVVYAAGPGWTHVAVPAAVTRVDDLAILIDLVAVWAH